MFCSISGGSGAGTGTGVTFSAPLEGMNAIANTHYENGAYVLGGVIETLIPGAYQWLDIDGGYAVLIYEQLSDSLVVGFMNSNINNTAEKIVACGISHAIPTYDTPLCSSVGVTFNRSTGVVTFTSSPIYDYLVQKTYTGISVTGSLSFDPF